jgi:hypothetical protein
MMRAQVGAFAGIEQDTFETAVRSLEGLLAGEDPREYVIREDGAITFSLLLDPAATGAAQAECVQARVDAAVAWLHGRLGELLVPRVLIDWRWSEDVLSRGGLKTRVCGTIV